MRALAQLLLALSLAALGCGGSSTPATQTPGEPDGAAPASDPQPGDAPAASDAPGAPLDEAECNRLADHLVELSLAEKPGKSADGYSAEDAETAKRELRQKLQPMCAQLPRRDYTCAMAAKSSTEMAACQPPPR